MVDVKVGPALSPTGQALRVRAAFPSHDIARRMEVLIRADLVMHGQWQRTASDLAIATAPASAKAPSRRTPVRARETEDQLKQRRARILRAMGGYPRLVWSAPV